MKKLIAISVVFALVAVAAFAQPAIGGQVKAGVTLITGSTISGSDIMAGGRVADEHTTGVINARAGDANGGGFVRVHSRAGWHHSPDYGTDIEKGSGLSGGEYYAPAAFTFVWWKPIEQLRLQFGHNPDGDWGAGQITGWGYNAEAQDFAAIDSDTGDLRNWGRPYSQNSDSLRLARGTGFYGGFKSTQALAISILPMDALAINIGLPFGTPTDGGSDGTGYGKMADIYMKVHFQVTYAIEDVGKLFVTYQGKGEKAGGDIFLSFYLTMIEGLGIDIGFNYTMPPDGAKALPIKIGLGVRFASGDFGVKARIGAALAGNDGNTTIGIGVLPYFNLGFMTAFLNIGVGIYMPKSGDMALDWYVNPYVSVPAGGPRFYAGIKVFQTDAVGKLTWSIPMGVNYYF